MLARGVKFRKAPSHTCGLTPVSLKKTIKFPKWIPTEKSTAYKLIIQRGRIVETKNALRVRAQKQVVAGITIPNGFEIWVPNAQIESIIGDSSSVPYVFLDEWKINEVLKTIFMEGLRNG